MSFDVCSSRHCNICLVLEVEDVPDTKESALATSTDVCLMRSSLSRCSGCQLVVYCSMKHQKMDWPLHRDLCRATQKLVSFCDGKHPYQLSGQPKSAEEMDRAILRVKFVLRSVLGRPLHYHEEELTSFPQYCVICYSFTRLYTCARCEAVSYCCEEHAHRDKDEHKRICGLLQLYYSPYKSQPLTPATFEFYRPVPDLHKMDLYEVFRRATLQPLPECPTESLKSYQLFNTVADFSCIGTICYALGFTEMGSYDNSKFVIFIVGAVFEQQLWFQDIHTKFFFSQFSQISVLHLFFIGPEAEGDTKEFVFNFQGQDRCVKYITYRGLFQDFSKSHMIKPSLIVAYNCDFSEQDNEYQHQICSKIDLHNDTTSTTNNKNDMDPLLTKEGDKSSSTKSPKRRNYSSAKNTWPHGILDILLTFDVPIVFTSYNRLQALFDYATVLRVAKSDKQEIHVTRIFNETRNPFRDLRPLRSWRLSRDDQIYYRNGYVQALRTRFAT